MRCSHIDEAASPKAKPLAPAAMPPTSAPSQRMARVSYDRPAIMPSAGVDNEDDADREHDGKAGGQHGEGLLAKIEKFDRQHAQAERHVDGQRDDDAEFGKHDRWLARQCQEIVERIGAAERCRQGEKVQRQENRQCDARQAVQHRRDEAPLSVRGPHAEYTAKTARMPRTRRTIENSAKARSSERPRHAVHSRKILRKPIGAWIATAITNRP